MPRECHSVIGAAMRAVPGGLGLAPATRYARLLPDKAFPECGLGGFVTTDWLETLKSHMLAIAAATELWAAVIGAIVGGLIAYFIQVKALREGRQQREDDLRRSNRALGYSLLFKVIKIHSNFYGY